MAHGGVGLGGVGRRAGDVCLQAACLGSFYTQVVGVPAT